MVISGTDIQLKLAIFVVPGSLRGNPDDKLPRNFYLTGQVGLRVSSA